MHFGIGRSAFGIQASCSVRDGTIAVSLNCYPPDAKVHYRQLLGQKTEIEAELGDALVWYELPSKKESRIYLYKDLDPKNRETWEEQFRWLVDHLAAFDRVFRPRIQLLEAESDHDLQSQNAPQVLGDGDGADHG